MLKALFGIIVGTFTFSTVFLSFALSSSAQVGPVIPPGGLICNENDVFATYLFDSHREFLSVEGKTVNDLNVRIFSSDMAQRTWTILVEVKPGVSCMFASGHSWTLVDGDRQMGRRSL